MKHAVVSLLIAASILLAACGDSEQAAESGAATQTQAPQTASVQQQPAQSTSEASAPGTPAAKADEPEEATEQVAETAEGAEAKDEPATKGTPPLKLAQLPPRSPAASKFKEGVNYTRLSPTQPVNVSPDQVQIVEFFWYGCPHCYALDPKLEAWRKGAAPAGKPDYVVFTRVPGAWSDIARFHARFYFAAESLGKLEELHPLIFKAIHEENNPLNTVDKAREFFAAHGVDAQAFQKNFGAMSLERKLDEANTFAQRSRVTGVPMFVVNGKFVLDVGTAGGEDQLIQLLNELAGREHVAR